MCKDTAQIYNDSHLSSRYHVSKILLIQCEVTHCGIPIVSYNIGGASEIVVPDINGHLVDPLESMNLRYHW